MRLFVLGATGQIGTLILKYGLERGHEITAFVRSPENISIQDSRLKVIKGDVYDASAMSEAMKNHDVVLSAFGPTTLGATDLRQKFGQNLATAAEQSNVKRLLVISSALLFKDIGLAGNVLRSTIFKQMLPDMANMENKLMQNWLDWTIVRPPRLSDGPPTHAYVAQKDRLPDHARSVSRSDVADFMLKEAEQNAYSQAIVGVC